MRTGNPLLHNLQINGGRVSDTKICSEHISNSIYTLVTFLVSKKNKLPCKSSKKTRNASYSHVFYACELFALFAVVTKLLKLGMTIPRRLAAFPFRNAGHICSSPGQDVGKLKVVNGWMDRWLAVLAMQTSNLSILLGCNL